MTLALITCQSIPEPDPDEALLLEALERADLPAELVAWDDPEIDWSRFDLCVLRSCWNYPQFEQAFREWLELANGASRVLNPVEIVRWNLDKRYLLELEARGIAIVPTRCVPRGEGQSWSSVHEATGWKEVVIKPAVSAGSYLTRRFGADEDGVATDFLHELAAQRDVLVQPFLRSFEEPGERAVVWIDGEVTHTVRKRARFSGDSEQVSEGLPVSRAERELVERVLAPLREKLLYGRVDLVTDDNRRLLLSELELIEPSLFLLQSPEALERFVKALGKRMKAGAAKLDGRCSES